MIVGGRTGVGGKVGVSAGMNVRRRGGGRLSAVWHPTGERGTDRKRARRSAQPGARGPPSGRVAAPDQVEGAPNRSQMRRGGIRVGWRPFTPTGGGTTNVHEAAGVDVCGHLNAQVAPLAYSARRVPMGGRVPSRAPPTKKTRSGRLKATSLASPAVPHVERARGRESHRPRGRRRQGQHHREAGVGGEAVVVGEEADRAGVEMR